MKKDIEWLKSAIQQNLDFYNDNDEEWQMAKVRAYAKSLDLINQLDEPEVLSDKWIDDNSVYASSDGATEEYVHVDDLQNLLVPKQEEVDQAYKDGYEKGKQYTFYKGYLEGLAEGERKTNEYFESIAEEPSYEQVQKYLSEHGMEVVELPVIPKFVAEFLIGKEDYMLYELFDGEWLYGEHDQIAKWLYDNDELMNKQREIDLVMARNRGYSAEKEQKYRVIFPSMDENGKGFNYLAKDTYHNELWIEDSRTDGLDWEERSSFTENEIRDMEKGDILFEHFAVKVEELEE